jgi:ubiquinone/menaquinone biosynthesis C-methylase UbiE
LRRGTELRFELPIFYACIEGPGGVDRQPRGLKGLDGAIVELQRWGVFSQQNSLDEERCLSDFKIGPVVAVAQNEAPVDRVASYPRCKSPLQPGVRDELSLVKEAPLRIDFNRTFARRPVRSGTREEFRMLARFHHKSKPSPYSYRLGWQAMDASGSQDANRAYYNAFSERYEQHRGTNDPGGYHELLDELEAGFVERFGRGKDVLEVGCGTGLVLERIQRFAATATGIDLSPGMLQQARARGLHVTEGSALKLPFADASFDVTCSFKVLAHIPEIATALAEMARVTRPGGYILAEFYNPWSLRGLLKRFGPKRATSNEAHEGQVYLRFDSPTRARQLTPFACRFVTARGVRIAVPSAYFMRVPGLRPILRALELRLCDSPARDLAGFWIAAYQKT